MEDGSTTAMGDCLRTGVPGSMRAVALLFGGITERAWGGLALQRRDRRASGHLEQ